MKNVLVLISSAAHPALNDGAIRNAIAVLQAQDWPGNARQLRNSIERLLILVKDQAPADGVITAALLLWLLLGVCAALSTLARAGETAEG